MTTRKAARKKGYEAGDVDFPAKLIRQSGGGGRWLYVTQESLALAVTGSITGVVPGDLVATRTVLDPGTGQILVRIKKQGW